MQAIFFLTVALRGLVWTGSGQPDVGVELQKLSDKVDDLGDTFETGIENVEDEIDNVGDEIDQVGNEIDNLRDNIGDVEDEIGDVEDDLDDLKSEVRSLRSELQSGLSSLGAEMQSIAVVVQELKGQMSRLTESTRKGFQETVEINMTVTRDNAKIQQQIKDMSADVHMLTETVTQLEDVCNSTCPIEDQEITPSSCSDVMKLGNPSSYSWHPLAHSGYYKVRNSTGSAVEVYCDMERHCCGNTGGWMRVAHLDTTDPSQQCPPGFRLRTDPKRVCERTVAPGCTSITFPTHGVQYSRVCGQINAYQYGSPDAFGPYYNNHADTLEGNYLDGLSITYGQSSRMHIWTFAAGIDEVQSDPRSCPCTNPDTYTGRIPPFVRTDYFCETGSRNSVQHRFYHEDPLWDGKGCGPTSSCCHYNTPPWFCKELPQPTTDDIEVRVCTNTSPSNEDILLQLIELFVQ